MNIFVTKLSPTTTNEDLHALFGQFGKVSSARVIMNNEKGESKGFAFVEMDDISEALTAIEEINNTDFDGSRIVVTKAKPKS